MTKISIIIPIYNSEKYLKRCLDSLINQTLKDVEIICINDGSTDGTSKILSEYQNNDSRIIIINQENKKQGAARNRGIEIATGEFVTFVDSDDWIDKDYCEKLYNAAIQNNVNIAMASITRDYENKIKEHFSIKSEQIIYGANNILDTIDWHLETAGKLYKYNIISDLRFTEGVYFEDAPYSLEAIIKENSLITVPNTCYHYYSNSHSTIKTKGNIAKQNDKIEMNLLLYDIAKKNNINLEKYAILKERHFFYTIKHYINRKDIYLFGIKVHTKKKVFDNSKIFLVFNTAYFGDVLLCNSLCQNIKTIFPESKVVFVVNKGFEDVAQYQHGVDDVIVFDKKDKHKGIIGIIKFIKNFKYKNIYASFVTYRNSKNIIIAKMLKSKYINIGIKEHKPIPSQIKHNMLLQPFTNKKIKNYPIKYDLPNNINNPVKKITNEKYIVLCTTSKRVEKNLKINTAIELINKFTDKTNYKIVFVGKGNSAVKYSEQLKNANCNFIDLTDKTNVLELGKVLQDAQAVISVDTGTMHYAISLNKPVCAVFYEKELVINWAPNPDLYNSVIISENQNAQNIYDKTKNLLEKNNIF